MPDVSLIEGICSVLGVKADTLLGIEEKVVENGNPMDDREIKNNMIDNLKSRYPGVADDLIPEQIPYIKVEQRLKELIKAGKNIKDLIHIVEELKLELKKE